MGPKFETYTRYSEVDEKEQKNVSGLIKGSFEIYTRQFCVDDKEQGQFFVKGSHSPFNFFKGNFRK